MYEKLSIFQAYKVMYEFLYELYYENEGFEDMGVFLGDYQFYKDRQFLQPHLVKDFYQPMDPAAWEDWSIFVKKSLPAELIRGNNLQSKNIEQFELTYFQAYNAMYELLKYENCRFGEPEDFQKLMSDLRPNTTEGFLNSEIWLRWLQYIERLFERERNGFKSTD